MKNTSISRLSGAILVSFAIFTLAATIVPASARAFELERLADPLCLFLCDNDPENVTNTYTTTYTDSNNINSNVNSPGATVNAQGSNVVQSQAAPASSNTYGYNVPQSVSVPVQTTVNNNNYNYDGSSYSYKHPVQTPSYNYSHYNYSHPSYSGYNYGYSSPTYNYVQTPVYHPIVYQTPVYVPTQTYAVAYNPGLDVGCFADPANAKVNQPVTWSVEVVGGLMPYSYTWAGSDNLSGHYNSVTKYYSMAGLKAASVTVVSADGLVKNEICTNEVKVTTAASAVKKSAIKTAAVSPAPTPSATPVSSPSMAASLLSLGNVPWGLVSMLIILLLFFTVVYLIFNRQKI